MEHTNEKMRMYALLCKVVFGEADEPETREVNAALEASAELRETELQLRATVSLVRGAYAEGKAEDELSAAAKGALASAAQAASEQAARDGATPSLTGGPWHASPVLRAAAGVTLIAAAGYGALIAVGSTGRPLDEGDTPREIARVDVGLDAAPESTSATAATPKPVDARSEAERAADLAKQMSGLGYDGGTISQEDALDLLRGYEGEMDVEALRQMAAEEVTVHRLQLGVSGGQAPADAPLTSYMGRGGAVPGTSTIDLDGHGLQPSGVQDGSVLWYGESEAGNSSAPAGGGLPGVAFVDPGMEPVAVGGFDPGSVPPQGAPTVSPLAAVVDELSSAKPSAATVRGGSAATFTLRAESPVNALGEAAGVRFDPNDVAGSRPAADVESASDDFFLGNGEARSRYENRFRHKGHWSFERVQPTRLPNERPHDMFFRFYGDNSFVVSKQDALSTFAADVDTASFALARRTLEGGYLPRREQVRTEEFVNFATPDLAPPAEGTFALRAELAPSPFGGREDRWLLRVGVRAKEITREERPPLALTFVVDTSGSMKENNRLELVKHALRLLVDQLDARDTIAIVAFSNEAREVLYPTPATASDTIETALFQLQPEGSTNAEAGLKLGYQTAEGTLEQGVQSRVVFLSDGVANVGQTDQDRIADDVKRQSDRGIFLNTIGVGLGNHNDVFLEQLADKGEGVCDYVGDAKDARRAIVERFVGGFVTVAKDVKIQVEFAPGHVLRWRQIGYENRAVRDVDFRNDAVDAGEIGAGHQVTCLYEVELASTDIAAADALATFRLRWKPVTAGESQPAVEATETSRALRYGEIVAPSFRAASEGFRRSALSAQLAECLRRSVHVRGDSVEALGKELAQLLSDAPSDDTAAVASMTRRAIELGLKPLPGPRPEDVDAAHREAYYRALIRDLGGAEPAPREGDDSTPIQQAKYEQQIRDILNRDLERKAH